MSEISKKIATLILAAGQSKRMHQSKIVLPWGNETVISHIISVFKSAGIENIIVVTGGYRDMVEAEVKKTGALTVYNPDFENDEMSISLHAGLNAINCEDAEAIFISLGDQPNIFSEDLQRMMDIHQQEKGKIIIPSYNMHRGHPWLIPNNFYTDLLGLNPPETMRSFLKQHDSDIKYLVVDHPEILSDMDTPQDYERLRPDK